MKSPRGQRIGEISVANNDGTANKVENISDAAMLRRKRLVTVRMSLFLLMTMQTRALPKRINNNHVGVGYS